MSRPPSDTANQDLQAVLACLEIGVLTVDRSLRVYFANPAGQELIRRGDGLRIAHGRLHAATADATRLLIVAVGNVAHRSSDGARPTSHPAAPNPVVAVADESDTLTYRIVVAPLGPRLQPEPSAWPANQQRPTSLAEAAEAALFVDTHRQADAATEAQIFQHGFQLTRAEATLAAHLLSGESLGTAAEKLGVTLNTVRSQLRSIFEKTQARRQADLVRLLASHLFLRRLFANQNKNNSSRIIRSGDAPQRPTDAF